MDFADLQLQLDCLGDELKQESWAVQQARHWVAHVALQKIPARAKWNAIAQLHLAL